MKKIIAQTGKELRQFSRDKLTLALALVLPMILMWLIGTCISLTVHDLPVAIKDMDQTPLSRHYVETVAASITFRIVPATATGPVEAPLDYSQARAVIVIPEHFARDLERGQSPDVQWLVDGTDANTASTSDWIGGTADSETGLRIAAIASPSSRAISRGRVRESSSCPG